MKLGLILAVALLIGWSAVALLQLWWQPFSWPVFIKLSISALVLEVLLILLMLVRREYLNEKSLKDKGFID